MTILSRCLVGRLNKVKVSSSPTGENYFVNNVIIVVISQLIISYLFFNGLGNFAATGGSCSAAVRAVFADKPFTKTCVILANRKNSYVTTKKYTSLGDNTADSSMPRDSNVELVRLITRAISDFVKMTLYMISQSLIIT